MITSLPPKHARDGGLTAVVPARLGPPGTRVGECSRGLAVSSRSALLDAAHTASFRAVLPGRRWRS